APLVLISSLGGMHTLNYAMGNPSELAYVGNSMLPFTDHMTFLERFENVMLTVFWDLGIRWIYMPRQEALRKEFFGASNSSIWDLRYSASLALLNSHFSINYPRPLVPAVLEVGGMQVQRSTQPLPRDLQTFLDGAKKGAIYFSLGSNVRIDTMPPEKLNALLDAFAELPQRVLFKWESDSVPVQLENVKFSKWFPQQDILAHPNLRLFFTHGGLLSIQEAAYHGIPLIGLPLFGDQFLNLRKAESDGYAVMLTLKNLTKSSVLWAVNKILHDKSMHLEAQRRSALFRDQLETPLERAVFWVEHVLRHKGAPHLRSAALDLAWYQLYLLDVAIVIRLFIFGIVFLLRLGWRRCCRKPTMALSDKKNK
ncbi:UDP-glycosyltransferase-07b, partial [Ephemera danica]